jgi:TolB-like protein/tetratricopeptide (TPR) repeat protein
MCVPGPDGVTRYGTGRMLGPTREHVALPQHRPSRRIVRFAEFEADLAAGHLLKRGERVPLRHQAFEVLAMLLERPDEVVTREELRARLWPDDVFVSFDNNLNSTITRLRAALGDSVDSPCFIETLPKRGYRFVAQLAPAVQIPQPEGSRPVRLMVLPLQNLSGDPAREYFSDAMTDSIITELACAAPEEIAVIARTTSMRYRGSHQEVTRVARELNLDYIVEGGVWQTEDRVTINAQLIRVDDQTHLFARRYEAAPRDVFGIHQAIAHEVSSQIVGPELQAARRTTEGPGVPVRPTDDATAYTLYLRGRHELQKWSLATAKPYLEEAVSRDPNFALAYDALAELDWYVGFWGFAPPREIFAAGTWAAVRALEIDPRLADTHALLGMYRKELDYNWSEVEREMQLARELTPTSPVVRLRYAISGLTPHCRFAEAIPELEAALESDPLSPFVLCWLTIVLDLARQYDRALECASRVQALEPDLFVAHLVAGHVHRDLQRIEPAVAAFRRAAELTGNSPTMLGWLGMVLAQAGEVTEARALLTGLERMASASYVPATSLAWIHLGLKDTDAAFAWLDRAIDDRDPMIIPIRSYPFLDALRGDPRYSRLVRKMSLEP